MLRTLLTATTVTVLASCVATPRPVVGNSSDDHLTVKNPIVINASLEDTSTFILDAFRDRGMSLADRRTGDDIVGLSFLRNRKRVYHSKWARPMVYQSAYAVVLSSGGPGRTIVGIKGIPAVNGTMVCSRQQVADYKKAMQGKLSNAYKACSAKHPGSEWFYCTPAKLRYPLNCVGEAPKRASEWELSGRAEATVVRSVLLEATVRFKEVDVRQTRR